MSRIDRIAAFLLCTTALAGCSGSEDQPANNTASDSGSMQSAPMEDKADSVSDDMTGYDTGANAADMGPRPSGPPSETFIPGTPPPPPPKK